MQRGLYKKLPLCGLFTDFKHHSKSWANSKRMRAKRERQMLKNLQPTQMSVTKREVTVWILQFAEYQFRFFLFG